MKDLSVYNAGAILGSLRVDSIGDSNVGNFTVMETYSLDDRDIEALGSQLEVELAQEFKKIPKTFNDIIAFATDNTLDLRVANADGSGASFIVGGLVIAPDTLPNGAANVAYSELVVVSGLSGDFDLQVVSGELPTGITISPLGAGVFDINGTPTVAGTFTFVLRAIDSITEFIEEKEYSITITA